MYNDDQSLYTVEEFGQNTAGVTGSGEANSTRAEDFNTTASEADGFPIEIMDNRFWTVNGEFPYNEEFHVDAPSFEFDPFMAPEYYSYDLTGFEEGYVGDDEDLVS